MNFHGVLGIARTGRRHGPEGPGPYVMVLPKATSFRPKWSRRQPLRSQPPRGATPDQSQDQQQDDRPHESDKDGPDHAVKRRCDMGRAEDQPAEERSDDSDDDVASHAQTAAHDSR